MIIRAILTAYYPATHTADVRPILGPAAVLQGLPVLMSCRADELTADRLVAVLLWSDVSGIVLGGYGALPPDPHTIPGGLTVVGALSYPSTPKFLVQVVSAYNNTDSTHIARGNSLMGWPLIDAKHTMAFGTFYVPFNYASALTIQALVWPSAAGDAYARISRYAAADTEAYTTHGTGGAWSATTLLSQVWRLINSCTLTGLALGDFVALRFERSGADPLDTINTTLRIAGFLVSLTADA